TLAMVVGLRGPLGGIFFVTPLAAIILIALALGTGPGLTATAIFGLGIWLGLVAGYFELSGANLGRLASFLVAALLICLVAGRLRETTRRLRRERLATAEADARTEAILASISDAFVSLDREWRYTYVNPAAEKLLGRPRQDLLGRILWDPFPDAVGTPLEQRLRKVAGERSPDHFQHFYEPWDRWFDFNAYPAEDGGVSIFFRDITESRRASEALAIATERMRRFVEANTIGIVIGDAQGKVFEANDYFLSLLGFTREELESGAIRWDELTPPEHVERNERASEQMRATGRSSPFEMQILRKDGSRRWILVGLAALPGSQQAAFVLDIADRKAIEATLREREAMLAAAQKVANVGSWELELGSQRAIWSDQLYAIYGVAPDSFAPTLESITALVHPDDLDQFRAHLARLDKNCSDETEFRIVRPDGTERTVLVRAEPLPGEPQRLIGIVFDVTERRRAERELRESEERFRRAIIGAPFPIMLHADDGRIVEINEALTRATGYTIEDIPTADAWTRAAYGKDYATVRRFIDELYSLDHPISAGEHVVRTKDGRLRIWEFGAAPLGTVGGKRLAMTMALDVTERRRAEERLRQSEERLRVLAENSQDIIFRYRLAPPRGYEYVSPASTKVIGYTPEEFYAQPELALESAFPDDRAAIEALLAGKVPPVLTTRFERKDGRVIWLEQRLTAVRDEQGKVVAIDGVARDITERKQAEEALLEADRRKDEFLGMLSHELRNPLAPIRNSLYLLRQGLPPDPRSERALEIIDRQTGYLTRIIEDLLDVTRITRGKIALHRTRLDLAELVGRTVEDYRSIFEANGVELLTALPAEPLWASVDPTRFAQALGNLLQNSAKFTQRGGKTEVLLARDDQGRAVLEVSDTGIGIEPSVLARLFEPFSQARQPLDRARGGLGLGLALVKGLVELHGGEVRAYSAGPGQGARFVVKVPLEQAEAAAAGPKPALEQPVERRVLVIEDNRDTADTIRDILELAGHRVEVAYSGPEGLARAREMRPDVVLCDIGLPGMDGYAIARAIRADPTLAGILLVAVTGYARPGDRRRAVESGFDRHITKPPSIEQLESVVAEAPGES
ncbi:MAG: PAS domain S-box protein, partial [Myxococcales bacterium]